MSRTVRGVALVTKGYKIGSLRRYVTPEILGGVMKPFVFLDHISIEDGERIPEFGFHPHSGIATVTFMLSGESWYEETTGAKGVLAEGSVEWMNAGAGVWHRGGPLGSPVNGFQLWVALPQSLELSLPHSQYVSSDELPEVGPVKVILGEFEGEKSEIRSPEGVVYISVQLEQEEEFIYTSSLADEIVWVLVHSGSLLVGEWEIKKGELVVFDSAGSKVLLFARHDSGFILGAAPRHPYPLVIGPYSVHTSEESLAIGEANISRIASRLK